MSSFTAKDQPNKISRGHLKVNLTLCKFSLEQENDLVENSTNLFSRRIKKSTRSSWRDVEVEEVNYCRDCLDRHAIAKGSKFISPRKWVRPCECVCVSGSE